jgi:hypothetical protein
MARQRIERDDSELKCTRTHVHKPVQTRLKHTLFCGSARIVPVGVPVWGPARAAALDSNGNRLYRKGFSARVLAEQITIVPFGRRAVSLGDEPTSALTTTSALRKRNRAAV